MLQFSNLVIRVMEPETISKNLVKMKIYKSRRSFLTFLIIAALAVSAAFMSCGDDEKEKTFTVTFNSNGGSAIEMKTVKEGDKVAEPNPPPTLVGSTFDGWYTDNGTFAYKWNFAASVITADVTLYAKWNEIPPNYFTVNFDSNGGNVVQQQSVKDGEKVPKPNDPTKEGHTFAGWFREANFTTEWKFDTDVVHSNITLFAKWSVVPQATLRYETVPYNSSIGASSVKSGGETYHLAFAVYDDDDEVDRAYYFYVLGLIRSVPLASTLAIYYNGVTPQTISYQRSDVNETSISNSVATAIEYSITESRTNTWEVGVEVGFDDGLVAKASSKRGGSQGWDVTNSRSLSNTLTTSQSTASGETFSYTFTIGEKNEPAGSYRYALFSIVDVYYVVVTDRKRESVIETKIVLCARPVQTLIIDYDPEMGGSFGKTAPGALLQIPEIRLVQLPEPEPACEHVWTIWQPTTAPTCTTDGEETRVCLLNSRHRETRTIPATGHRWGNWVETGSEIIRTCTNANCSEQERQPIVTQYSANATDEREMHGLGGNNLFPWRHTSGLTIESLKAAGYREVTISVDFRRRAAGFLGSEYEVSVYSGHPIDLNGVRWGEAEKVGLNAVIGAPPWGTHNLTRTVSLDDYNNQFTVFFRGTSTLDWRLGERTVTVTAKK